MMGPCQASAIKEWTTLRIPGSAVHTSHTVGPPPPSWCRTSQALLSSAHLQPLGLFLRGCIEARCLP